MLQQKWHGLGLITPSRHKFPAHSDLVKPWNFHMADWKCFCILTGESDTSIKKAYQEFCESLLSAAKQCIPCGHCKNYVPCWDKECETLYRCFVWAPVGTDSDRAASSLLFQLEQKKQERCEELSIPSTSRTLAPRRETSTNNKLTGRSGHSSCLWPVLANSIASQLVKNGAHRTRGRESTRLINKELSNLWKVPTPEGHSISDPFGPEELAASPSGIYCQESLRT